MSKKAIKINRKTEATKLIESSSTQLNENERGSSVRKSEDYPWDMMRTANR